MRFMTINVFVVITAMPFEQSRQPRKVGSARNARCGICNAICHESHRWRNEKTLLFSRVLALAEAVGFEPTNELPRYRISSAGRYDHFDTLPYVLLLVCWSGHRRAVRIYGDHFDTLPFVLLYILLRCRNLLTHYSIFILILQQILSCISS